MPAPRIQLLLLFLIILQQQLRVLFSFALMRCHVLDHLLRHDVFICNDGIDEVVAVVVEKSAAAISLFIVGFEDTCIVPLLIRLLFLDLMAVIADNPVFFHDGIVRVTLLITDRIRRNGHRDIDLLAIA